MGELTSTDSHLFCAKKDLAESDVEFQPSFWGATRVVINIGRTKADQSGQKGKLRPRVLPVERGSPAELMRDMIAWRHGARRGDPPVLRAVPLFQNGKRAQLTREGVMRFMRSTLRAAGWSEARTLRYGTHSCRIGGCTSLFQLGATAEVIKNMGGWSSDAYKAYLRVQQQHLMSFASRMCTESK